MTTAPTGIQESIWLLSSDPYAFHTSFMESQTCLIMDSKPWVLEEVGSGATTTAMCTKEEPPLVVRQHYERPAKYVALGPHVRLFINPFLYLFLLFTYIGTHFKR